MIWQHFPNVNGTISFVSKSRACVVFIFLLFCLFLRPISNFSITMETEKARVISERAISDAWTNWQHWKKSLWKHWLWWKMGTAGKYKWSFSIVRCERREKLKMELKCRSAPFTILRVILLKTIKKRQSGVSNDSVIGGTSKYLAVIYLMPFHWLKLFRLSKESEMKYKHCCFYSLTQTAGCINNNFHFACVIEQHSLRTFWQLLTLFRCCWSLRYWFWCYL